MSSTPLQDKVVLITGASKGIGRATALHLASLGASVVVNYSRDAAPAEELVNLIGRNKSLAIKADVGKVSEIKQLVKQTVDRFGRIDVLALNAGLLANKDLASTTEDDFDQSFSLNVKGPYFLAQEAATHIPKGGRILFFSTSLTADSTVTPNYLLYLATKGAIEQMARVLAKDFGRRGIHVNVISPGPVGTELFYNGKSEEVVKAIANKAPAARIAEPQEIAEVVGFMSGPGAAWINGQNIRVNGGLA